LIDSGTVELIVTRCTWDYSEAVWPDAFAVIREHAISVVAEPLKNNVLWRPRLVAGGEVALSLEELCRD
jgi:hypothetical protein